MPWNIYAYLDQILSNQVILGNQMTAIQTAIAALQGDVSTLSSTVTTAMASQFTDADVQNLQSIDAQVKGLIATLSPPAPTPAPTPTPAPAPAPAPAS